MVPVVALLVGLNLAGPGIPVSQIEHYAGSPEEPVVGVQPNSVANQSSKMAPLSQIVVPPPSRLEVSPSLTSRIEAVRLLPTD